MVNREYTHILLTLGNLNNWIFTTGQKNYMLNETYHAIERGFVESIMINSLLKCNISSVTKKIIR